MALSSGMMVLRAMVLGWTAYSPPSTSVCSIPPIVRGGEGNDHLVGRKPPPPLFHSLATGFSKLPSALYTVGPIFREEVSPTDMTTYATTYGWRSKGVRRGLMTSPP